MFFKNQNLQITEEPNRRTECSPLAVWDPNPRWWTGGAGGQPARAATVEGRRWRCDCATPARRSRAGVQGRPTGNAAMTAVGDYTGVCAWLRAGAAQCQRAVTAVWVLGARARRRVAASGLLQLRHGQLSIMQLLISFCN